MTTPAPTHVDPPNHTARWDEPWLAQLPLDVFASIENDPFFSFDSICVHLARLTSAPAPNSGAALPGAVGDVIREIAAEFGLATSGDPRLRATGNLALEIGEGDDIDILISAHMDRPTFRVLNLQDATLYPLCAIRVPGDAYSCDAINARFTDDRVHIAGRGRLLFRAVDGDYDIRYEVTQGALEWGDSVQMHAPLRECDGLVTGTGLDNAAGVLIGLLAAKALTYAADEIGGKIIFAFTDQEEGPPIGLFGQGASRLLHAIGSPRLGFINIDGHNVDEAAGHIPGVGASHAFVSGYGRGSVVALEAQALATELAREVNRARPGSVKLNYGYVSRSDDMLLSLGARCLGLAGVVVDQPHTAEESASISDIAPASAWLAVLAQRLLALKR